MPSNPFSMARPSPHSSLHVSYFCSECIERAAAGVHLARRARGSSSLSRLNAFSTGPCPHYHLELLSALPRRSVPIPPCLRASRRSKVRRGSRRRAASESAVCGSVCRAHSCTRAAASPLPPLEAATSALQVHALASSINRWPPRRRHRHAPWQPPAR